MGSDTEELEGVVFDVFGNASKTAVRFKLNVECCSKYVGSESKDDPAGAAAAIRTRSVPENAEPKKPAKDTSEVNVIIWKEDFTDFKRKEHIWARTNPRIFNMVLGQCTQKMKAKLKGYKGWAKIPKEQGGVGLLTTVYRLCNQQDGGSTGLMEIVKLEKSPLSLSR